MSRVDKTTESAFQAEAIQGFLDNGWLQGSSDRYDRKLGLYPEDLLGFVQETQPKAWDKYCTLYPQNPEQTLLERVAAQLNKADPYAADRELRTFGTLGVLRHELRDRGARFQLCQFKPEHRLNPDTLARFEQNRCRIVPELVYSPWLTAEQPGKAWRIDLVLFVNGIPVATLELKSELKQSVQRAIRQYKETRLPVDPDTNRPEPLLTFKRGALVHFAVSQFEVYMTTKLAGEETRFLPFNRGTRDGGAGNDTPKDSDRYTTDYLWHQVLHPHSLLQILGRFIHLEIEEKEHPDGRKYKEEKLIFPRFHQWHVVTNLLAAVANEGPGHRYLIQHSAGSGKSNSIAWTAHQLSSLYNDEGEKLFHSVIVVTDRTLLDDQLQDTIYQFEHAAGMISRIHRDLDQGSKSEQLAKALETSQPIIIVTIQTFPFVLQAIEDDVRLKERRYAVIADEAHSSQSGSTARQLKEVLMIDGPTDEPLSTEDLLDATIAARRVSPNLSYFAFTATPKDKTLQLFGRYPNREAMARKDLPRPFHVYSMRQAIEEGFILDVLKNYVNYKVAYNLAMKAKGEDRQVETKRAQVKLNQWVRLHEYNIARKVQIIVEHFKDHVMGLLHGQAKAMVVTGSRKEAVRYKLALDKYIAEQGYHNLYGMVAFSDEVTFNDNDPNSEHLIGRSFTEKNMNPDLKGRDLRTAFDSSEFNILIVADKFQTGFDQPKLCAMYVDKKLAGVACVQTLSRLNRVYPGKSETGTFVLDFLNDAQEVLREFQKYYQTAKLSDVSDPNSLYDLFDKLRASEIFVWSEVEAFCKAFFRQSKTGAAVANLCKPALDRWLRRREQADQNHKKAQEMLARTKATGDVVLKTNAANALDEAKRAVDELAIFKKDLATFVRFYEFMSQIVDYDDRDLEKLGLFARHLRPLLRETAAEDDEIDLNNVVLSHYRLSKIREQNLKLEQGEKVTVPISPTKAVGAGRPQSKRKDFLSRIIERLNEIFVTDELNDSDMVNYARTISDKLSENERVMHQIANNTRDQAMLGDFVQALEDAIVDSGKAHTNQKMQLLSDKHKVEKFKEIIFDLLTRPEAGDAD